MSKIGQDFSYHVLEDHGCPLTRGWLVRGTGMCNVMQVASCIAQPQCIYCILIPCSSFHYLTWTQQPCPKTSFFAQNDVAQRPPSTRDIHGVSIPWHASGVCGETSPFELAGMCRMSGVDPGPSLPIGNVINTNCSAAHSRQALSCKMAVEYDKFIESGRK